MNCSCLSHNGFLTSKGYAFLEDGQRGPQELHGWSDMCYLDKVRSVSAFETRRDTVIFDDGVINDQYRRFLAGSNGAQD